MGTEIWLNDGPDLEWQANFGDWDRAVVDDIMRELGGEPHAPEMQTRFKASFAVPPELWEEAKSKVMASQPSQVIASGASDFDVLPPGANKGAATLHVAEALGIDPARNLLVSGDSGNDVAMFRVCSHGIVVGNAREELRKAVDPDRVYQAQAYYSHGILEGLRHWNVPIIETN